MKVLTPDTIAENMGKTFTSKWLPIEQVRINVFGAATDDNDPHHIDPEYCATHSPWGRPIAFGFLTLSLVPSMMYQILHYGRDAKAVDEGYFVNYGGDNFRFIEPVPVDSRIRGHFTPRRMEERKPGQTLLGFHVEVEIENEDRLALVVDWYGLWIRPAGTTTQ